MRSVVSIARAARVGLLRALAAAALGASAACSLVGPVSEPDVTSPPPPEHEPAAPAEPEPRGAATPDSRAEPAEPERPAPPPGRVLVVTPDATEAADAIAGELDSLLAGRYRAERVVIRQGEGPSALAAAAGDDVVAAVAVGAESAELAARELAVPVVVCRVFDTERIRSIRPGVYAVAALPPLPMQLRSWRRLAPSASTVGMIIGERHRALVEEARSAARAEGLELEAEFVRSDREMLYRFRRLAPRLDALWVLPDSEILSPGAVREMLDYALDHDVHSIVYTASLLEWGALVSVESRADDVAASIARVLDTLTREGAAAPPAVTPLSAVDVTVNEEVAAELGVAVRVSARGPVDQ